MFGEQELRRVADAVLAASGADETEAMILAQDSQLTRFASSYIHQNVAERGCTVRVRAIVGQRTGVASTNDVLPAGLQAAVAQAAEIARLQPDNPECLPLPSARPLAQVDAFCEATAIYPPEVRARAVGEICQLARSAGLIASGAFTTSQHELVVANSHGLFAYHPHTVADLNTVIMGEDSSGYASCTDLDVGRIDAESAGREAVDKALRSRGPRDLEPGVYPVFLEAYAVAEMLWYMAYLGFNALAVQEGRSFLCDRFGQALVDPRISVWDDGLDTNGLPSPFDFEGMPRQRVDIIRDGVAAGVVYDRETAAREGQETTGHGLPAPNTMGPFPLNLFMAPGNATREELLRSFDRGLWVTRFHYVNPVHPLKAILTGMTRDGTFLVEKGEVVAPVKNLRFTQGTLEALNQVLAVGQQSTLVSHWHGALRVPGLAVGEFRFSGATEF
jgi:predicted Zn-dependent protease